MGRAWYATSDWNEQVEEEFEARLRRARAYKRPQYLRIKAHTLLKLPDSQGEAAARKLLRRILDEYPDSLDVPLAHETLGELSKKAGDLRQAEHHFRACLDVESGTSGAVDVKLAEALVELGDDDRLAEASGLLERVVERIRSGDEIWPSHIFRAVVASARLASRVGNPRLAAQEARSALRIASMKGPIFPRHPDLGKMEVDAETFRALKRMAQGAT